jgi:hypothetical protein
MLDMEKKELLSALSKLKRFKKKGMAFSSPMKIFQGISLVISHP